MDRSDECVIEIPHFCTQYHSTLYDLQQYGFLCDATIETSTGVINVHRCVLVASSVYFYNLEASQVKEANEEQHILGYQLLEEKHHVVELVVQLLYTGKIVASLECLEEIESLCKILGVNSKLINNKKVSKSKKKYTRDQINVNLCSVLKDKRAETKLGCINQNILSDHRLRKDKDETECYKSKSNSTSAHQDCVGSSEGQDVNLTLKCEHLPTEERSDNESDCNEQEFSSTKSQADKDDDLQACMLDADDQNTKLDNYFHGYHPHNNKDCSKKSTSIFNQAGDMFVVKNCENPQDSLSLRNDLGQNAVFNLSDTETNTNTYLKSLQSDTKLMQTKQVGRRKTQPTRKKIQRSKSGVAIQPTRTRMIKSNLKKDKPVSSDEEDSSNSDVQEPKKKRRKASEPKLPDPHENSTYVVFPGTMKQIPQNETKCIKYECQKTFKTQKDLLAHFGDFPSHKRPKQCPTCEECFWNKVDYDSHRKNVHPPNQKQFVCSECGKLHSMYFRMIDHLKQIHNIPYKDHFTVYKCNYKVSTLYMQQVPLA